MPNPIYIRLDGARVWCVPRSATIGHSIVTRCGGRANQSDPVLIASNVPSGWRCTACVEASRVMPAALDSYEGMGGETAAVSVEIADLGGEA